MKYKKIVLMLILVLSLCACKGQSGEPANNESDNTAYNLDASSGAADLSEGTDNNALCDYASLVWEESIKLEFADQFKILCAGNYRLITIVENGSFLLVAEGDRVPENVPKDIVVLQKPLNKAYLTSSSVFDIIEKIEAYDNLKYSGYKANSLYIDSAVERLENGSMVYAGKYSAPDYELLVGGGCDLAIENTMIYHTPEVKEQLLALGIPVLVERSSYEAHPLGRMEWIKLYGALFDREKEAADFFETQMEILKPVLNQEKTECTVAFFYVNTNGVINVRKPGDYISKMIELAGGSYILEAEENEDDNALSTMNMQMEAFYLAARDADVIIYNGTTTGVLSSIEELLQKDELFAEFKAVRENRVYCTGKNFFQETTAIGELMEDLSKVIRGSESTEFHQLVKLQ